MGKRSYSSAKRQEAAADTRAVLLAAARALLGSKEGSSALTIDAVALKAGTARMTVYNHFASKNELLEALLLDLAEQGGLRALPDALAMTDPLEGLDRMIETLGRFWSSQPVVLRRLRALAALDPAIEKAIVKRDGWRRSLLAKLLERAMPSAHERRADLVEVLWALTSFEGFCAAAGPSRPIAEATPRIQRTVRALIGERAFAPTQKIFTR